MKIIARALSSPSLHFMIKQCYLLRIATVRTNSFDFRPGPTSPTPAEAGGRRRRLPTYPASRIHSKSMHGYPWKSKDIQVNIHKSMDNWRLISIKHGYSFMNIYCLRISIAQCPCMGSPAWISVWISIIEWIIKDWHPKIMDTHTANRHLSDVY